MKQFQDGVAERGTKRSKSSPEEVQIDTLASTTTSRLSSSSTTPASSSSSGSDADNKRKADGKHLKDPQGNKRKTSEEEDMVEHRDVLEEMVGGGAGDFGIG